MTATTATRENKLCQSLTSYARCLAATRSQERFRIASKSLR
jgi:hypothetical protein